MVPRPLRRVLIFAMQPGSSAYRARSTPSGLRWRVVARCPRDSLTDSAAGRINEGPSERKAAYA